MQAPRSGDGTVLDTSVKPRCDPGREQPPALPFRQRQKYPGYTERGLPGGGGRGAHRAEGTACDRVWQGRLWPADTGAELGALAMQGGEAAGVDGPGVSGENKACPGCHGCRAQSQLWDRVGGSVRLADGKLILEPQCGRGTGAKSDQSPGSGSRDKVGERERKTRVRKGGSWGPAVSARGPRRRGRNLKQALEGFQTPGVPSPLLLPWGWGDGMGGAGQWSWVLQSILPATCPQPPSRAPWVCTSLLSASLREAPSSLTFLTPSTHAFPTPPLGHGRRLVARCDSRKRTDISPVKQGWPGAPSMPSSLKGCWRNRGSGPAWQGNAFGLLGKPLSPLCLGAVLTEFL